MGAEIIMVIFLFMSGLGIFSIATTSEASNLLGGILGSGSVIGGAVLDMFTNYSEVIQKGLALEGVGYVLALVGTAIFSIVMLFNFLGTHGRTLIQ